MKHIKRISVTRADAFIDFFNAFWRAWRDFQYNKKYEMGI